MIKTLAAQWHKDVMALGRSIGRSHIPSASMRWKVNCAMSVQTRIGCQLSHLYWKTRVDSTQMIIKIMVTNKTTVGIIILRLKTKLYTFGYLLRT